MRFFAPVIFKNVGDHGFRYQVPTDEYDVSRTISVTDEHGNVLCKQEGWKEITKQEMDDKNANL